MKFAEKENINLLEEDKAKITFCDLNYCFSQAVLYPTGCYDQNKVFEINNLEGLTQKSKHLLNTLGMISPKQIQFKAVPGHLTAVSLFDSHFMCEIHFETEWYPFFDFADSDYENLIQQFMKNCILTVSPSTYEYYSEQTVECTVGMVQLLLLNFWLWSDNSSNS